MSDRISLTIATFAIILIVMAGCTQGELRTSIQGLTDEMKPGNFTLNASDDIMNYSNGTCLAMVCTNKTPSFPFNIFFDSSLKGGNCSFQPCNETTYPSLVNGTPSAHIRLMMFGAGHSYISFSDANTYCNNSMKMSVKWLIGSNASNYQLPQKSRAECFLDKNIIPVYILHSNQTNINYTRAGEIAAELNGAGPVIIVSESELDDSNTSNYALVKNEINSMKSSCPKCLIALGVKLNGTSEYNVTSSILSDSSVLANVDLVAYGLNSHNFKDCNPDKMYWAASAFSKHMLHNYSKPSVITYVLFDAANSSDNSCTWDNITAANGYSLLYGYADALLSNGVIGASLYSFYGGGPLACRDCAFADANFGACSGSFTAPKIEPRFTNYFGLCQAYYTGLGENISGVMPIVFSNGSQNCNFAYNSNMFRFVNISANEIKPLINYEITQSDPFFSCVGCFGNGTGPRGINAASGSSEYCTKYFPSIEIAADNWDMDPTLLRAVVWQESSFDHCAVSEVSSGSSGCNSLGLTNITDPDSGSCGCGTFYANSGNKTCAYGLAQVIEYPITIYRDYGISIPDVARLCASNTTSDGYPDFNPFRPYDGPCAYAYKFMNINLPSARSLVISNLGNLGISDNNSIEWHSVFLALYQMNGYPSTTESMWISSFGSQRSKNANDCGGNVTYCCGNTNFYTYVKECRGVAYGYDVLSKYLWLANPSNCATAKCPDTELGDRNSVKYLCTHGYMETECCNAANILGYYSLNKMCISPPANCKKYCR